MPTPLALRGTDYLYPEDPPTSLRIQEGRAAFVQRHPFHGGEPFEEESVVVPWTEADYRQGQDNSGQPYEVVTLRGPSYHTYRGQLEFSRVTIQTWDRREIFVDGWRVPPMSGRGRNNYPRWDEAGHAHVILALDKPSRKRLVAFFDSVKAARAA